MLRHDNVVMMVPQREGERLTHKMMMWLDVVVILIIVSGLYWLYFY